MKNVRSLTISCYLLLLKEHYKLKFTDFRFGKYSRSDGRKLEGLRYLELLGTADKTHQLSVNHTTLNSELNARRIVDNPDDPMSLPKIFERLKALAGPGQTYVYCRPASEKRLKEFQTQGFPDARTDPDVRVGRNKISTVSKNISVFATCLN